MTIDQIARGDGGRVRDVEKQLFEIVIQYLMDEYADKELRAEDLTLETNLAKDLGLDRSALKSLLDAIVVGFDCELRLSGSNARKVHTYADLVSLVKTSLKRGVPTGAVDPKNVEKKVIAILREDFVPTSRKITRETTLKQLEIGQAEQLLLFFMIEPAFGVVMTRLDDPDTREILSVCDLVDCICEKLERRKGRKPTRSKG
ncbi:hypothetical protein [Nannocystis bainbridge]|uniref:DUF4194 domain-containing protein n=1 Tax=Nannocystis bainbridge TaxID=2995303 RepID=A0ABT5DZS4_9BACT|nr:hypothetical protein [Nannocystis bainbridge]MDC0719089.1 hypothetical protein [Nannocystis bainbridge]